MTKTERINLYDEATELWGLGAQFDQMIEEMAELTVALNKYKRKHLIGHEYEGDNSIEENLIEELADVTMCLEQLSVMFGEDKINKSLEFKLNKLDTLIKKIKAKKH